ncbi:MAG: DNA gyrase inhibitor YacG [Alphaproteobacteria bacterium]|nr:DNA gyrase inhibitor YacG [Alphaproteobacteria bacterium]
MNDRPARRCPLCGKPVEPAYRPFCGKRCADLDLARWLGERYRVPAAEEDDGGPEADDKD